MNIYMGNSWLSQQDNAFKIKIWSLTPGCTPVDRETGIVHRETGHRDGIPGHRDDRPGHWDGTP